MTTPMKRRSGAGCSIAGDNRPEFAESPYHSASCCAAAIDASKRKMQHFKLPGSAQRFLSILAAALNSFNVQRHLTSRHTRPPRTKRSGRGGPRRPHELELGCANLPTIVQVRVTAFCRLRLWVALLVASCRNRQACCSFCSQRVAKKIGTQFRVLLTIWNQWRILFFVSCGTARESETLTPRHDGGQHGLGRISHPA
jgi:hypothetical protein